MNKHSMAILLSVLSISACSQQSYRPTKRDVIVQKEADKSPGTALPETQETDSSKSANPADTTSPAAPAAPKTATVRSSEGSGGPTGLVEVPFTDSTGLASTYKINAPADAATKVYGLHIHFHGDGGGGYTDFPNKETRNDLIGVTVKAPNANLQWGRAEGKQHALYANELIQKDLLKKYKIDLDKIYFSTVSGGSFFILGSFLPEYGQLYNSAAFVMCGGEAPRVAFADPKMLGKFRIHVEVTAGDRQDIQTNVQAAIDAYKTASTTAGIPADVQAKLQTSTIAGAGGHCAFDGVAYTSGIQQAIDTKFKSILPQ